MSWARRLASGAPVDEPMVVMVAHPDDESLWTGALLRRLRNATLVSITDGAPRDMTDARRLGFATRDNYARRRRGELDRALNALGFTGKLVRYDVPDQEAVMELDVIAARLERDSAGAACIVTHPYEGGHPDHDAVALAASRTGLPVVEFACYAQIDGERRFGCFVEDPASPAASRMLNAEDRARIDAALASHASQRTVFGEWRPRVEQWRDAPRYSFDQPPPGEACLYDGFGWAMTSARWRELARLPEPA